ncbi:MAG: glycosyltransferase [Fimbriiglobus sp.]
MSFAWGSVAVSSPPWLVFADDWGRHPSSCQHLIRTFLPNRDITWVNTIGTRPPRLDRRTAERVVGKLKSWVRPQPKSPDSPTAMEGLAPKIVAPKMWPSFASSLSRGLNKKLLLRGLMPVVEAMPAPPIVISTLPIVADLIGVLPASRWVYYCVDDFSVWPGYDGKTMGKMEAEFLPKVNEVIAVSPTLIEKLKGLGKSPHLLTHGVDLPFWERARSPADPPEFSRIQGPIVLFWGVIDRRMDTAFVRALSQAWPDGTIVLVGPKEDPDPELQALPRVVVLPPVSMDRLPDLASRATVLMMPYIDAPVTQAMQPLKLKEYLATGKPCVVRRLGTTEAWADALDLAATPREFAEQVKQRVTEPTIPDSQAKARERLQSESWRAKAEQFEKWVTG